MELSRTAPQHLLKILKEVSGSEALSSFSIGDREAMKFIVHLPLRRAKAFRAQPHSLRRQMVVYG
jgi:hypothetical protein